MKQRNTRSRGNYGSRCARLERLEDRRLLTIATGLGNISISDTQITNLIDADGDGYYSSFDYEVEVTAAIMPNSTEGDLVLLPFIDGVLVQELVWKSGYQSIASGAVVSYTIPVTVTFQEYFDYTFELYERGGGDWALVDSGHTTTNVPMEPLVEDGRRAETPDAIAPSIGESIFTLTPDLAWSPYVAGPSGSLSSGYQVSVSSDTPTVYDFDAPPAGEFYPEGWSFDPYSVGDPYMNWATQDGRASFQISTRANSWDRQKIVSDATYTTGTYDWSVYLPDDYEPGASSLVAGFLYDYTSWNELDFEIGYGTAAERAAYGIPDGQLMCYMTVQRIGATPFSQDVVAIEPGHWYILRIELTTDESGDYRANWYVKKDEPGETFQLGREPGILAFGPTEVDFHVLSSVENFRNGWIGENQPTRDHTAYFDYVTVNDQLVYDTGFISDPAGALHGYSPGAFSGIDPTTGTPRISEPLIDGHSYSWQVRYRNEDDLWSQWSAAAGFDVALFAPEYGLSVAPIVVTTPSTIETAIAPPESVERIDEWTTHWVEIWVTKETADGPGIVEIDVSLAYDGDSFTQTGVEFGTAFTDDRDFTPDDPAGRIDNITARATDPRMGSNAYVLFARVRLEPTGADVGIPVADPSGDLAIVPLSAAVETHSVRLFGDLPGEPTTAAIDLPLWPVIYDLDDNQRIGISDLAQFAVVFGSVVGAAGTPFNTLICNFDGNSNIGIGDLAFFAANFGRAAADQKGPLDYAAGVFTFWQSQPAATPAVEKAAIGPIAPTSDPAPAEYPLPSSRSTFDSTDPNFGAPISLPGEIGPSDRPAAIDMVLAETTDPLDQQIGLLQIETEAEEDEHRTVDAAFSVLLGSR